MERVYLDEFDGAALTGAAARHVGAVLRLKRGDVFAGYDGRRELILRVTEPGTGAVRVEIETDRELPEAPGSRITLAPALIKGRRWDWLLEKAAELGVGGIQPVAAERSVVKLQAGEADDRVSRWRRMLGAAAAQCAGRAPDIAAPVGLEQLLRDTAGAPNRFILVKGDGIEPLAAAAGSLRPGGVVLLTGPEGDWTEREVGAALESGVRAAQMGRLILRSETAAVVAATIITAAGGEEL